MALGYHVDLPRPHPWPPLRPDSAAHACFCQLHHNPRSNGQPRHRRPAFDGISAQHSRCSRQQLWPSAFTPMLFQGEEWELLLPLPSSPPTRTRSSSDLPARVGRRGSSPRAGWDPKEVAPSSDLRPSLFSAEAGQNSTRAITAISTAYRELFALRGNHAALRTPWADSVLTEFDEEQRALVVLRGQVGREYGGTPKFRGGNHCLGR